MTTKTKTSPINTKPLNKGQLLEALRDLGSGATDSVVRDVATEIPREFFRQLMGLPEQKISGDITPGEELRLDEVLSGQAQERKKLKLQLAQEQQMRTEEQSLTVRKQQELKIQLGAIAQEVIKLAQTTQGLSREVQIAAISAPVEPGIYHLIFFEKLLEFLHSFRKKIENASEWLAMYNARAKKRAHTFWAQVGVGGAKRLLSPEDYLQRAAG